MINIEDFDSNLLKIDKKSYKNIGICNIGYITIKKIDDYENIYSVNPLYLITGKGTGHIKENHGNKYLVSDSTDENKEVLKKHKELWDGIKNEIENINDGGYNSVDCKYGKDFTKIEFDTDDDFPSNKPLNLLRLTRIVRSVFEDESEFFPQVFLDEYLYEL